MWPAVDFWENIHVQGVRQGARSLHVADERGRRVWSVLWEVRQYLEDAWRKEGGSNEWLEAGLAFSFNVSFSFSSKLCSCQRFGCSLKV